MPRVAELVGPAGVGKSSLALALTAADGRVVGVPPIPRRHHILRAPFLVGPALQLALPHRADTRKGLKRMLHVAAIRRYVDRHRSSDAGSVLLFDEGPVYYLARLRVYGGDYIESATVRRWWARTVGDWRRRLDVVVLLDAPDALLARRITVRPQAHGYKGAPLEQTRPFLRAYRDAYRDLINTLCVEGGPELLRVDTSRPLTARTTDSIVAALTGEEPKDASIAGPGEAPPEGRSESREGPVSGFWNGRPGGKV